MSWGRGRASTEGPSLHQAGRLGRGRLVALNPERELEGGRALLLPSACLLTGAFPAFVLSNYHLDPARAPPPPPTSPHVVRDLTPARSSQVRGGCTVWRPRLSPRLMVCEAWVSRSPQDLGLARPSLPPSRTLEAGGGPGGAHGAPAVAVDLGRVASASERSGGDSAHVEGPTSGPGLPGGGGPGSRNRSGIWGHSIATEVTSRGAGARDP